MTTKTKSTALKAAFKSSNKPTQAPIAINGRRQQQESGLVMIGANFPKRVRQVLGYIEADTQRHLKSLLGEAINDLAVKYGQPTPYEEVADVAN